MSTKAIAGDKAAARVTRGGGAPNQLKAGGVFKAVCRDSEGNVRWEAVSKNLVVNVGLAHMNGTFFKGSSYTAAWYIGLYGAGGSNTPAAADTMTSHAGWTEVTAYSGSTRPSVTFGAQTTADPSVIANSASPAQFTINATATVGGAFLTTGNGSGGTTGTLFSAADFSAPGDRTLYSGDVLSVVYTFSLDAS